MQIPSAMKSFTTQRPAQVAQPKAEEFTFAPQSDLATISDGISEQERFDGQAFGKVIGGMFGGAAGATGGAVAGAVISAATGASGWGVAASTVGGLLGGGAVGIYLGSR